MIEHKMMFSELNSKLAVIKLNNKLEKLKAQTGFTIQSLLFSKQDYTLSKAKKWAFKHGHKTDTVNETTNFIHLTQQKPSRFEMFRTIDFGNGIQARMAGNPKSKFVGQMMLKGFSKFGVNLKSDLEITIPARGEVRFLKTGSNRDGIIMREDLEETIDFWNDRSIIDWHDMDDMKNPTSHRITDQLGFLENSHMELIDGDWYGVADVVILDRKLAFQLYVAQKRNKPLEISPEYGWTADFVNGQKIQRNIRPHLLTIVEKGHIKGNQIRLAET